MVSVSEVCKHGSESEEKKKNEGSILIPPASTPAAAARKGKGKSSAWLTSNNGRKTKKKNLPYRLRKGNLQEKGGESFSHSVACPEERKIGFKPATWSGGKKRIVY